MQPEKSSEAVRLSTMSGNKESAAKGRDTKLEKYGPDYYSKIGTKGGAATLGRKHTEETKRKISETKRKAHENNQASN